MWYKNISPVGSLD